MQDYPFGYFRGYDAKGARQDGLDKVVGEAVNTALQNPEYKAKVEAAVAAELEAQIPHRVQDIVRTALNDAGGYDSGLRKDLKARAEKWIEDHAELVQAAVERAAEAFTVNQELVGRIVNDAGIKLVYAAAESAIAKAAIKLAKKGVGPAIIKKAK
jgi:hypothetical protein